MELSRTSQRKRFVAVVLLAAIVALVAWLLFSRQRRILVQKELYAKYVAWNAWREPSKTNYAKLEPYLDRLESIDPYTTEGYAQFQIAFKNYMNQSKNFVRFPKAYTPSAQIAKQSQEQLNALYSSVGFRAGLAYDLNVSTDNERVAYNLVIDDLIAGWAKESGKPIVATRAARLREAEQIAYSLSGQDLRNRIKQVNVKKSHLDDAQKHRAELERALAAPEFVPEGLDLNFARSLQG